jgi:ABC-type transport system substrate-binding protein
MDAAKRKAQYREFQKIVVDECPVAFIIESTWAEAWSAQVVNPPKGIWGGIDSLAEVGMRKA